MRASIALAALLLSSLSSSACIALLDLDASDYQSSTDAICAAYDNRHCGTVAGILWDGSLCSDTVSMEGDLGKAAELQCFNEVDCIEMLNCLLAAGFFAQGGGAATGEPCLGTCAAAGGCGPWACAEGLACTNNVCE